MFGSRDKSMGLSYGHKAIQIYLILAVLVNDFLLEAFINLITGGI